MKILVLGGAGFLGTNLVLRLLQEPSAEITILDSLDPRFRSTLAPLQSHMDKIHFFQGDMTDSSWLERLIPGQEIIFNCAGQSSHVLALKDPAADVEINCIGNLKLLETLRKLNPESVVVYPSSSTVIGKSPHRQAADETHREEPLEIYSADKAVIEHYYRIYHELYGLKTVVLRFSNLYGPYAKPYPEFCFLNYLIELARTGQAIEIFGTGTQKRNVMYVEDASEILWRAAHCEALYGKTFFATSPFNHSINDIAKTIISVFERGSVIHVDWPQERRKIEVGSVKVSSAKLESLTGWRASYSLTSGLACTKKVLDENPCNLSL